jgi:hypothetical protein
VLSSLGTAISRQVEATTIGLILRNQRSQPQPAGRTDVAMPHVSSIESRVMQMARPDGTLDRGDANPERLTRLAGVDYEIFTLLCEHENRFQRALISV